VAEAAAGPSRCPRCAGAFHCGAADAAPCACTAIHLDAALLRELRERYRGCLCLACLAELARTPAAGPPSASAG
jgi:hypothetical protein